MCAEASQEPILIVEDSLKDYEATMRAFRGSIFHNSIFHCGDSDQALDFLYRRGDYSNPGQALGPGIVMRDLNLPGTDGREVL